MTSQQIDKRPLSPEELFNRLLMGNFKEQQCEDQGAKVQEEKQILLSLIAEYRAEINKRVADQIELQRMLELRARLRMELQQAKQQRIVIDQNIGDEVHRFKLTPVQIRQQSQWSCQLEQTRAKNAKMGIRMKQLADYCMKMENYNRMLEKQGRVINQEARVRSLSGSIEVEDWRSKIDTLRKEHKSYSFELRAKIKQKQSKALQQIQIQEAQIADRNRERMSRFQSGIKSRKYFY